MSGFQPAPRPAGFGCVRLDPSGWPAARLGWRVAGAWARQPKRGLGQRHRGGGNCPARAPVNRMTVPSCVRMHDLSGRSPAPAARDISQAARSRQKRGPEPRGAAAPAVPVAGDGRTGPEALAWRSDPARGGRHAFEGASGFATAGEEDGRGGREWVGFMLFMRHLPSGSRPGAPARRCRGAAHGGTRR